jgi:hypothetical protein
MQCSTLLLSLTLSLFANLVEALLEINGKRCLHFREISFTYQNLPNAHAHTVIQGAARGKDHTVGRNIGQRSQQPLYNISYVQYSFLLDCISFLRLLLFTYNYLLNCNQLSTKSLSGQENGE